MPSDHLIDPADKFCECLKTAADIALDKDCLVTIGIQPTFPATGYGYIRRGKATRGSYRGKVFDVLEFREKPKLSVAKQFLKDGGYYWNAGVFVGRAEAFLDAIEAFMPDLHKGLQKIKKAVGTPRESSVIAAEYEKFTKQSIDFGVMEKVSNVKLVESNFRWDDVGSWLALERTGSKDRHGNVSAGMHIGVESRDSIFYSGKGHIIVTVGIQDIIVVSTPDATLVCHKDHADKIKDAVRKIQEQGHEEYL